VTALPVFNEEPLTSVLGVMRFPEDLGKARLYASWKLAGGIVESAQQQGEFSPGALASIGRDAADFAPHYAECARAEVCGTAVGAVTNAMFRLIKSHPTIATWDRAIAVARNNDGGLPSGEPLLKAHRAHMRKVHHFWGALDNSSGKIDDLDVFFARAEIMLREIAKFEVDRAKGWLDRKGRVKELRLKYDEAFHAPVNVEGVSLSVAAIPGSLLKAPTAKKMRSEKIRT
jgi:hypothetical protein